jgi:hypothetical protein
VNDSLRLKIVKGQSEFSNHQFDGVFWKIHLLLNVITQVASQQQVRHHEEIFFICDEENWLSDNRVNCLYPPWNENQILTRKGCSNLVNISTSLSTFFRASRSMHWCLFMYFMANICLESFFCTIHTWKKRKLSTYAAIIKTNSTIEMVDAPGLNSTETKRVLFSCHVFMLWKQELHLNKYNNVKTNKRKSCDIDVNKSNIVFTVYAGHVRVEVFYECKWDNLVFTYSPAEKQGNFKYT